MSAALVWLYAAAFTIASAWSGIEFKFAAQSSGKKAVWHFVLGNIIGALGPVALTLALKRANPNVIYALCFGGAFALLQILSWRLFEQSLSVFQWMGIACVGIGICLLQIRH